MRSTRPHKADDFFYHGDDSLVSKKVGSVLISRQMYKLC
jgi:hypothetical protein